MAAESAPNWTFLTRHAQVLLCIADDPGIRVRDIATNPKWKSLSDPDMMILHVIIPKVEEVPVAADAAAAAAAGAGSGPATLVTILSLLACFLAGALLHIAGLPRLLLRASRLERPG